MIKLNIDMLLKQKGKTRYWLIKQTQSDYKTINKICENESTGLYLETIEKLCKILECTPNDLFTIE